MSKEGLLLSSLLLGFGFSFMQASLAAPTTVTPCTAKQSECTLGSLTLSPAWSRAMPSSSANGSIYLTIRNNGKVADTLIRAESDPDRAKYTELHTHIHDGGVMRMRKVEAIPLPARSTVTLKPGAEHIMLIDLKKPLNPNDAFPLTLYFEKAGALTLNVTVKGAPNLHKMDPHQPGKH